MKICIIVPVFNEELHLKKSIKSFLKQTYPIHKLIIVNDSSTDNSLLIAKDFEDSYNQVLVIDHISSQQHSPGKKVINAFYKGLECISIQEYDLIGKFDGDIVLPENYFHQMMETFNSDKKIGLAAGNLYIEKNNKWVYENISDKSKTRGPTKLYRRECFTQIGGLKNDIGWDTVDELLARYHGWEVKTNPDLHVKHLRPTGQTYNQAAKYKQGEAFYKLRYGWTITFIASAKMASLKKDFQLFKDYMQGFRLAKKKKASFLVTEKEGQWIRKYRWKKIKQKLMS